MSWSASAASIFDIHIRIFIPLNIGKYLSYHCQNYKCKYFSDVPNSSRFKAVYISNTSHWAVKVYNIAQEEWGLQNFRDCNGVSNGIELPSRWKIQFQVVSLFQYQVHASLPFSAELVLSNALVVLQHLLQFTQTTLRLWPTWAFWCAVCLSWRMHWEVIRDQVLGPIRILTKGSWRRWSFLVKLVGAISRLLPL